MSLSESVRNFFVTLCGRITGKAYTTHKNGYPTYHYSRSQQNKIRAAQEKAEQKRKEIKRQVLTFTWEDMTQYDDLPFVWNKDLMYTDEMAFMPLVGENREVALDYYIRQVSKLIYDTAKLIPGAEHCFISKKDVSFDYPKNYSAVPFTFLECRPFTPAGKKPKYPAIIHFRSVRDEMLNGSVFQHSPIAGTIRILCDGQIGAAQVQFAQPGLEYNVITFSMSLYGLSLVVKRVDSTYGNLYKFEDIK